VSWLGPQTRAIRPSPAWTSGAWSPVLAGQAPTLVLASAPSTALLPAGVGVQRTVAGLIARDPGEFVGRRAEQRVLPMVLTGGRMDGVTYHGVLLRGIGGVGKTTLAAEVIRGVQGSEPARRVVTITGATTLEGVLAAVAGALRGPLLMAGSDGGPVLQALTVAGRMDLPLQGRWQVLREYVGFRRAAHRLRPNAEHRAQLDKGPVLDDVQATQDGRVDGRDLEVRFDPRHRVDCTNLAPLPIRPPPRHTGAHRQASPG
jgi:hypothetical protein